MTIGVVNELEYKSEYESQKIQQNKQQMESNLVQPWDRIDSGKNTLNERPKRSQFLTTANLSSITQRLQLHGHVTKGAPKTKAEAWTGNKLITVAWLPTVGIHCP